MGNITEPVSGHATLREATSAAARILPAPDRRRAAINYLGQRGIDAATLPDEWPLGYAPRGWTKLTDELRREGFPDQVLLDAGLARRCSRGTLIDVFRDRVIFPIHDHGGDVAGFIGRDLSGAPSAPKYLNTGHTPLFDKGHLLYGLHEANTTNLNAIRPVLVEGPLDVLAITARARLTGDTDLLPIATSGTALTHIQAMQIADAATAYSVPVVVAMDGDAPGRAAALAAGERLRLHDIDVKIATLPNGCDPADYLTSPGASLATFRQDAALPLLTAQVQRRIEDQGDRMQWVEGRLGAGRSIAAYLTEYPREHAARQIGWIAEALDVDRMTFARELAAAYMAIAAPTRSPHPARTRPLAAAPVPAPGR